MSVRNNSTVALDVNPTALNLTNVFLRYGPEAIESSSITRSLGVWILLKKEASAKDREQLNAAIASNEYQNKKILTSVKNIISSHNNIYGNWNSQLDFLEKNSVDDVVRNNILNATKLEKPINEYVDEITTYLNKYYQLLNFSYDAFMNNHHSRLETI